MDQYSNERRWYLKCTSKTSIAKKKYPKLFAHQILSMINPSYIVSNACSSFSNIIETCCASPVINTVWPSMFFLGGGIIRRKAASSQ